MLTGILTSDCRWLKAHPFVSELFREIFSHPYISFFHSLDNGFSVTSFRTLFENPLPSLYWGVVTVGREKIKGYHSTPSANEQANDVILVHTVQLKPMIKAQMSGRMICSGISDVAIASVYSEITRLKNLIIIFIIMNKLQETTFFGRCQKLTSALKLRTEK